MRVTLVALLVASCASAPRSTPSSAPSTKPTTVPAEPNTEPPARTAALFSFQTGFWINLHLDLVAAALEDGTTGDAGWDAATATYRKHKERSLLFDAEWRALTNRIRDAKQDSELPAELREALTKAAPFFRSTRWSERQTCAAKLRTRLEEGIDDHGEAIHRSLENVYATPWPAEPIPVALTGYAWWTGAYTTTGPTRITMACDNDRHEGTLALEIVFHEASHALVDTVEARIEKAFTAKGASAPKQLWHAVLFYATGEVVERHVSGHTSYAETHGLYTRGSFAPFHAAMQATLADDVTRDQISDEALQSLVAEIASP